MIPVTTRKDQSIALFGLGGSGIATAQALIEGGAHVTAYDDNPERVKMASGLDIPVDDLRNVDFAKIDALVLAPGVPLTHPKPHWTVDLASAFNVPVIGDIELFAAERRVVAPESGFVAITGTNGKSTTTALISHILDTAGFDVQMGGNIGKAVLTLDHLTDTRTYVIECSSYQIDLSPSLDPSVGILLNLAPDHLDRHGDMERYAAIKARLVAGSKIAVVGTDDPHSAAIADQLEKSNGQVVCVSTEHKASKTEYFWDGVGICNPSGSRVVTLENIPTLRGRHNAQNAAACIAACNGLGIVDHDVLQSGLNSFPGLAHRMEILGNVGTSIFVNDSKGTNADAAAMALSSFENIHWIAGGLAKEGGIESLRPLFGHVAKAYLIGEAAPDFAATLGTNVPYEISGTIESAVANAARDAAAGERDAVVMLSPACASFDQYKNFELRGEAFRTEVQKLPGFVPYGGK
ncbi:MAG: UDP-N-acetylmuramoyl-L-alanine--D-glutamate ligase [Pseudomonadota bacterium]